MKTTRRSISLYGLVFLAACGKEPPPVSVAEFMENPRLLEATMIRCGQNRAELKYEPECIHARDAVNRLEAREKKVRREELEAMSERKRQALRRTQQAAAEARRRALEEAREKEQAEYMGIPEDQAASDLGSESIVVDPPAVASGNAPAAEISPPDLEDGADAGQAADSADGAGSDLNAIRDELKRRQGEPQ